MYLIKYAHNDHISDLDLYHIRYAILNDASFKFDTDIVVSVTFDISSGFVRCMDLWLYILHNVSFDFEWKGSDMNWLYVVSWDRCCILRTLLFSPYFL